MVEVTVILPNYNHALYFKQRIESILNQTFQDFELIIFDDASTDDSLIIMNHYRNHPKVSHFIVNTKNSGSPFIQWRKGIELAKGKYIWIAETDDFAEATFLEHTVSLLENAPDSSLAYTDARIVDKDGTFVDFWSERKNKFFKTNRWSENHDANGIDEILNHLLYKVTINNASSVLFKREHLNNLEFLEKLSNYKNTGDLHTYLHMATKGDLSYFSIPLNNYRTHPENITKTNTKNGILYKERILCFSEITDILAQSKKNMNKLRRNGLAYRFILRKNIFYALKFNQENELLMFVKKLTSYKILSKVERASFIVLIKLHKRNRLKSKKLSRYLIKILLNE